MLPRVLLRPAELSSDEAYHGCSPEWVFGTDGVLEHTTMVAMRRLPCRLSKFLTSYKLARFRIFQGPLVHPVPK
jgi:hypothetical protein